MSVIVREIIDKIFNNPTVKYELTEFQGLGKEVHEMIDIFSRLGTGKQAGKKVFYIKPLAKFYSEKKEIQVYVEGGKSNPEEIIRQLWVYKLIHYYNYSPEQIRCEIPVQFGSKEPTKYADIAVYRKTDLATVKVLFEVKKPKRKEGIEQLKSYLGAKGNPIGVWSNGTDRLILYKPQNKDFDTLSEIPQVNQEAKDVLEIKRTLEQLKEQYNFKKIVQDLEELVLADSGVDEFNEIFKIIFAKIWDEKEASENRRTRPHKELMFRKFEDPALTYDTINGLFKKACSEWKGVFKENEDIELRKDHLQVCIGPVEPVRLMGSNLRIMDDAFEYLMPTEAKKKKGQFFTPRHVIEMCVRMLNPKDYEYVMDPSCGSAGFLLHAMEWAMPAKTAEEQEERKHKYAAKFLWGIDFEARAAKTSRALMLIAGDGHTNIFGPDISSIDPSTWYEKETGIRLISKLRETNLLKDTVPENEIIDDKERAWKYLSEMNFDIVLANPPFAGEMKDKTMLNHYELAKPALRRAGDKQAKEERDVLFIERIVNMLRPGGRAAIILPQGKFNNSSLAFIREWILRKARLLAVVGLHVNTFKPHTGTKTSVLVIQKYTIEQLEEIEDIQRKVKDSCPDYENQIQELLKSYESAEEIPEENIPQEIFDLLVEEFSIYEEDIEKDKSVEEEIDEELDLETDKRTHYDEEISELKDKLYYANEHLLELENIIKSLRESQQKESILFVKNFSGDEVEKTNAQKQLQIKQKAALKLLQDEQKPKIKELKREIKRLENIIPLLEQERLKLTNKGRLQLILQMLDCLEKLRNRYIDAQVALALDYPIFMAVSEHGGKNNSGDYEYQLDEKGNIVEDTWGNPEIAQDLVNHKITRDILLEKAKQFSTKLKKDEIVLKDKEEMGIVAEPKIRYLGAKLLDNSEYCIAEAFVEFAIEQGLDFWKEV